MTSLLTQTRLSLAQAAPLVSRRRAAKCEVHTYKALLKRSALAMYDDKWLVLLQAAPSLANPAQQSPAQGPLASGCDGDAFAASILVEPEAAEAQQAPARHSPSQRPADAAQSVQPAAAPGPEPMDAASDEPVVDRGPAEQPLTVDAAPVQPASAAGEPIVPARPPVELPAGDRALAPSEPDAVEPGAHFGQAEAVAAEVSHPSPTTAAEPDLPPAHGLEQPLSAQPAPPQPPEPDTAAGVAQDGAVDARVPFPREMPDTQAERPGGEPAMPAQAWTSSPDIPATVEAVPAGDREAQPDADVIVSVGVEASSTANAEDGCTGDAATGSISAAPRADEAADLQQPCRAVDAEPLPAEGTQAAGMGPAVSGHGPLPTSAGAPEAAEQGGGTVPAEPARPGDHVSHAMIEAASTAEADSQPPAASGRVCLRCPLFSSITLVLHRH